MNSGDTAWVLISAALVLFMTPGLALFYGGMVRSKGVLAVMMQSFICIGVVTVLWAVVAFSLAFGNDAGGGLIGKLPPGRTGQHDACTAGVRPRSISGSLRSPSWCFR